MKARSERSSMTTCRYSHPRPLLTDLRVALACPIASDAMADPIDAAELLDSDARWTMYVKK